MNRSQSYTIAAILMLFAGVIGVITALPGIMSGPIGDENSPPLIVTVVNFVVGVLAFVAAYGVWRTEKWGVILTIILAAFIILNGALTINFAPPFVARLLGGVGVLWGATIIVLLLRSGPRTSAT